MLVRLVTDYSLYGRGFRIYIVERNRDRMWRFAHQSRRHISVTRFPSSYDENAECIWRIDVAHGSKVLFAFVDLDLEAQPQGCAFDFVEIRNERERRSPLIGRYCNSLPVTSKSNSLYIKFKSDSNLSGRGFKARYKTRK